MTMEEARAFVFKRVMGREEGVVDERRRLDARAKVAQASVVPTSVGRAGLQANEAKDILRDQLSLYIFYSLVESKKAAQCVCKSVCLQI